MKGILIWGVTSQARLLAGLAREYSGFADHEFVFHSPNGAAIAFETTDSVSYSDDEFRSCLPKLSHFLVAIGGENGSARVEVQAGLINLGLLPAELRSESSFMDASSEVGTGLVLMPGAVVNKFCRIGDQCIINTNASVDHECSLGNGVHVMGSAAIAGRVTLCDYVSVGTNATILPDLTIGEGAIIGAGSVVTRNVEEYSVVIGNPAKEVKKAIHNQTFPRPTWFEQIASNKASD